MRQPPQHGSVGFVLDLDPDLGARLPPVERTRAREAARGRVLVLPPGRCDLGAMMPDGGELSGLLIVAGLLCSDTALAGRHLMEYLGPGDILSGEDGDNQTVAPDPSVTVVDRALLVALGEGFFQAAARWPDLLAAVLARLEHRRRRLAAQAVIVHLPQARHRLLLMLWHLAARWGHVGRDGVHVDLPLTHDLLGRLTAARRPTVSLAIKELDADGYLTRLPGGAWLITPRGREEIERLTTSMRAPATADGRLEQLSPR